MTLQTNLDHISTEKELTDLIATGEPLMVCCGRMGPMCVPVYDNIRFRDMAFDSPESAYIKKLPECSSFRGLPFTVYWKDGKVVKATSSIQSKEQITTILDTHLKNGN
jgi:thioredoxin 1